MKKTLFIAVSFVFFAISAMAEIPCHPYSKTVPEGFISDGGTYIYYNGQLKRVGSTLAIDNYKMPKEMRQDFLRTVSDVDLNPKWDRYNAELWTGVGLMCAGGVGAVISVCYGGAYFMAAVVGTVFVAPFGKEAVDNMWADIGRKSLIPGSTCVASSAVCLTGLVLVCVGGVGLKKTVNYCNSLGMPQEAYLDLGPTANGVGLTFKF